MVPQTTEIRPRFDSKGNYSYVHYQHFYLKRVYNKWYCVGQNNWVLYIMLVMLKARVKVSGKISLVFITCIQLWKPSLFLIQSPLLTWKEKSIKCYLSTLYKRKPEKNKIDCMIDGKRQFHSTLPLFQTL